MFILVIDSAKQGVRIEIAIDIEFVDRLVITLIVIISSPGFILNCFVFNTVIGN